MRRYLGGFALRRSDTLTSRAEAERDVVERRRLNKRAKLWRERNLLLDRLITFAEYRERVRSILNQHLAATAKTAAAGAEAGGSDTGRPRPDRDPPAIRSPGDELPFLPERIAHLAGDRNDAAAGPFSADARALAALLLAGVVIGLVLIGAGR